MRPASLLGVLIVAKLCMLIGREVPRSAWVPVTYFWQDLLVVALFAAVDTLAQRRPKIGWALYVTVVAYAAVNVPVARVLSTPLTQPMLRAAGGPLADSIKYHATTTNVALAGLVIATAAALPWLCRRIRPRQVAVGVAIAVPIIALGPLATACVETLGLHRNALVALVAGFIPRVEPGGGGDPMSDPFDQPPPTDGLARYRGVAAGRNVVLVLLESAAAQYLRPYGAAEDPMPNLTALAGHGMLFEDTYAVYPESIKALFALLYARYPAIDTRSEQYAKIGTPSIAAVLQAQGYRTALFHSGRFRYLGMEAMIRDCGYQVLEDAGDIGGNRKSSFGIDEGSTVRRMLTWIDRQPRGARFFITYVPIAGHHPYETPEPGPFPERREVDRYLNALHYADASLGEFVRGLHARGLDQDTLLVAIGDHGQAFGHHPGNFGHTLFIYEENVRVPLVVSAPGAIDEPVRVGGLTSHIDLAPTILDLLGLTGPVDYQGQSRLRGTRPSVMFFTDSSLGLLGLREGNWKYIFEIEAGRHKLFDLGADPQELRNIAEDHRDLVERYRDQLLAWSSTQKGLIIRQR
jgi:Sulfatase